MMPQEKECDELKSNEREPTVMAQDPCKVVWIPRLVKIVRHQLT